MPVYALVKLALYMPPVTPVLMLARGMHQVLIGVLLLLRPLMLAGLGVGFTVQGFCFQSYPSLPVTTHNNE
jgi:hypothetical protein